jgi:hypothetical protein
MGTHGVVVLPEQGLVWNTSPGRSLVLKLLGVQNTTVSMNEREKAEQRQRYGWEIVGANPL